MKSTLKSQLTIGLLTLCGVTVLTVQAGPTTYQGPHARGVQTQNGGAVQTQNGATAVGTRNRGAVQTRRGGAAVTGPNGTAVKPGTETFTPNRQEAAPGRKKETYPKARTAQSSARQTECTRRQNKSSAKLFPLRTFPEEQRDWIGLMLNVDNGCVGLDVDAANM
jgi:hypothetical protein